MRVEVGEVATSPGAVVVRDTGGRGNRHARVGGVVPACPTVENLARGWIEDGHGFEENRRRVAAKPRDVHVVWRGNGERQVCGGRARRGVSCSATGSGSLVPKVVGHAILGNALSRGSGVQRNVAVREIHRGERHARVAQGVEVVRPDHAGRRRERVVVREVAEEVGGDRGSVDHAVRARDVQLDVAVGGVAGAGEVRGRTRGIVLRVARDGLHARRRAWVSRCSGAVLREGELDEHERQRCEQRRQQMNSPPRRRRRRLPVRGRDHAGRGLGPRHRTAQTHLISPFVAAQIAPLPQCAARCIRPFLPNRSRTT